MKRLSRCLASAALACTLLVTAPLPSFATEGLATGGTPSTDEAVTLSAETQLADEEPALPADEDQVLPLDEDPVAGEDAPSQELTAQESTYEGGTIPILRFTFHDDIDPDTGEVTLSGDEKIRLVLETPNHAYRAAGVSASVEVPSDYDNPEEGLWDGVSGYEGAMDLGIEFFRGRGNSTWRQAKKPFKFKLDKKADLFGMGSNKHWTLLANFNDKSLSLDRMVAWVGDQMGMPFTPRGVPVDLYLNDKYYGSYLLAEEVRVDKSRVDIEEVDAGADDLASAAITGGYLFGTNRMPTTPEHEYFSTSRGTTFTYDTPEYEPPLSDAQTSQQRYLVSFLDRVEDAIYGEEFVNAGGEHIWNLMDRQSTADMWLVQEFFCNPDAFATPSTYLYKLRDTVESDGSVVPGKLCWGPLWDFDLVWGQDKVEGFNYTDYMWINLLRQDPDFVETIKERWKVLDAALQELDREGGLLDQYAREIEESWNADHERWQKHDDDADSIQQAIGTLRSHFEARRAWFNAHLDEVQTSYHTVRFVIDDVEVSRFIAMNGSSFNPDPPKAPEKEGLVFDGWKTIEGTIYNFDAPVHEDATYHAAYLDPSTLIPATNIYFPLPEVWIRYGTGLKYDLFPLDAQDKRITWSSSDESVVTVDSDGWIVPQVYEFDESGKAEAIVTAHLVNSGNEASVRVVVYDPSVVTLPEPTSMSVDEAMALDVDTWQQIHLEAEPSPSTLNDSLGVRYESADESIATVTPTGVVYGVAPGTVVVKAILEDPMTGETITVRETTVTVSAHVEPEPEPKPTPDPEPAPTPKPTPTPVPKTEPTPKRQAATTKNKTLPQTGDPYQALPIAPMVACAAVAFALSRTARER